MPASPISPDLQKPKPIARPRSQNRPPRIHRPDTTPRRLRRQAQKKRLRNRQDTKFGRDSNVSLEQKCDQIAGGVKTGDHSNTHHSTRADRSVGFVTWDTDKFVFPPTSDYADHALTTLNSTAMPHNAYKPRRCSTQPSSGAQSILANFSCSPSMTYCDQLPHGHPTPQAPPELSVGNDNVVVNASSQIPEEFFGLQDHYIPSPLLYHKRSRETLTRSKSDEAIFRLDDKLETQWCSSPHDNDLRMYAAEDNHQQPDCIDTEDQATCFIAAALPLMGSALRARIRNRAASTNNSAQAGLSGFLGSALAGIRSSCYSDHPNMATQSAASHGLRPDFARTSSDVNKHCDQIREPSDTSTTTSKASHNVSCSTYAPVEKQVRSTYTQTGVATTITSRENINDLLDVTVCYLLPCLPIVASTEPLPHPPFPQAKPVLRSLSDFTGPAYDDTEKETNLSTRQVSKCWSEDLDFDVHHSADYDGTQLCQDDARPPPPSIDTRRLHHFNAMKPELSNKNIDGLQELSNSFQLPPAAMGDNNDCCPTDESISDIIANEAESVLLDWEIFDWESASNEDDGLGLHLLGL